MRGSDRFLTTLSLALVLLNAGGQILTAVASAHELGWYGLYLYGQAAVFMAAWLLARNPKARGGMILTASLSILVSWLVTAIIGGPLVNFYYMPYAIAVQWLLAALAAASVAARQGPQAADLGLFKALVVGLALVGLGLRGLILVMADAPREPSAPAYMSDLLIDYLVIPVLLPLLPLWLLWAAGKRAATSFTAGLAVLLAALPPLLILWCGRGGPMHSHYIVLGDSMQMTSNMLLWVFILTALTALTALVRDRRAAPETPAPKPVSQLKMSAALPAAGALVLAFFLALGYHQSQRPLTPTAYAGPMETYKFADREISLPAGSRKPVMRLNLLLGGERFSLSEIVRDSPEEIDVRLNQIPGYTPKDRKALPALYRDLSAETGLPSGLAAAVDGKKAAPGLELTMFVRYGDTGLVELSRSYRPQGPAPAEGSPELDEFRAQAVEDFLGRARPFFQNYQWLGPKPDKSGPGYYTGFGRLAEPPEDPDIQVIYSEKHPKTIDPDIRVKQPRTILSIDRVTNPRWRGAKPGEETRGIFHYLEDERLEYTFAYYHGYRISNQSQPLAGQPGRLRVEYMARPGPFLSVNAGNYIFLLWDSDDRENFPYRLSLSANREGSGEAAIPETLGLWQAVVGSFRRAENIDDPELG